MCLVEEVGGKVFSGTESTQKLRKIGLVDDLIADGYDKIPKVNRWPEIVKNGVDQIILPSFCKRVLESDDVETALFSLKRSWNPLGHTN